MSTHTPPFVVNNSIELLSSPKHRAERLKRIRNLANLNRKELSDRCGVNIHTLKGWENGRFGGLSAAGAKRILNYLNTTGVSCSIEWLLDGIGPGPVAICANQPTNAQQQHTMLNDIDLAKRELAYFRELYPDAQDFIVTDTSMQPYYQPHDYVAGIKHTAEHIHSVIGQDCIVETSDGRMFLRNLRKGTLASTYTLVCHNLHYLGDYAIAQNVSLLSATPVVWHRKRH